MSYLSSVSRRLAVVTVAFAAVIGGGVVAPTIAATTPPLGCGTTPLPPPSPGTPVASAIGSSTVTLTWTAGASVGCQTGALRYDIFSGTTKIGETSGSVTTIDLTGLQPNSQYSITVAAWGYRSDVLSDLGYGGRSAPVIFTTADGPAIPTTPIVCTSSTPATAPGTPVVSQITYYGAFVSYPKVPFSPCGSPTQYEVLDHGSVIGTSNAFESGTYLYSLRDQTSYTVTVRARTAAGAGPESEPVTFSTLRAPVVTTPPVTTPVVTTPPVTTPVVTTPPVTTPVATTPPVSSCSTQPSTPPQTTPLPSSPPQTSAPQYPPTAPASLQLSNITDHSATLVWGASEPRSPIYPVVGYDILDHCVKIASTTGTITATTISLVPLTTYSITVRARISTGAQSADSPVLGFTTLGHVDPTQPSTPQPPATYRYAISGSSTLKTLVKGTLPISGSAAAAITDAGAFSADLTLANSQANLTALGFLPVSSTVSLVPTGPATGTLSSGALSVTAKVRIKLLSIKVVGIPVGGGSNCQASQISTIPLNSVGSFSAAAGGTLAGVFSISGLTGCGALNGLISPITAGGGNALSLKLAAVN